MIEEYIYIYIYIYIYKGPSRIRVNPKFKFKLLAQVQVQPADLCILYIPAFKNISLSNMKKTKAIYIVLAKCLLSQPLFPDSAA